MGVIWIFLSRRCCRRMADKAALLRNVTNIFLLFLPLFSSPNNFPLLLSVSLFLSLFPSSPLLPLAAHSRYSCSVQACLYKSMAKKCPSQVGAHCFPCCQSRHYPG
jgi:hypothetical protein